MANEGINRLARTLESRIKRHDDKPPILDFGTVQKDRSLITNKFPLPIWEFVYGYEPDDSLTLEYRRARLMAKKYGRAPINPAHIEAVLSELTGCPVYITEHIAPYTFLVEVDESALFTRGGITGTGKKAGRDQRERLSRSESAEGIYEYRQALRELRRIKPSHLSFKYISVIRLDYEVMDCGAAGVAELWREFFMEEHDISTDGTDGNAAAACDWWLEFFCEEIDVATDAVSWNIGAEVDFTRTHYAEADSPILTRQTNYNAGAVEMVIREFFTEDINIKDR